MTKKDYELIAGQFKFSLQASRSTNDGSSKWLEGLAQDLAVELEKDNSRFDRMRFLEACGANASLVHRGPSRADC